MKATTILGIGAAAICGALLAVGIMKSTSSNEGAAEGSTVAPSGPSAPEGRAPVEAGKPAEAIVAAVEEAAGGDRAGMSEEEIAERRDEFRNEMRERQMDQLTNKMAKWSAALGLDKGQQEKLLDIANGQLDELEKMAVDASQSDDPSALSDTAQRAMAIISGRALEESMADVLNPDQKLAYEEFGERQNESRAEARALRQLAGLQEDLMLTPEQRNSVYAILYENSAADVKEGNDVGSVIESVASSAGVTLDPSLQGMITSLANKGLAELASGKELNPESIQEMSKQAYDDAVTRQVDQLRPVLTEAQLELYRNQIESRLGGLMQRVGAGDGGE